MSESTDFVFTSVVEENLFTDINKQPTNLSLCFFMFSSVEQVNNIYTYI